MMLLSRLQESARESSAKHSIEVTTCLCSFRLHTSSRLLMSQTRTSPSTPPVTKKRWLWLIAMEATPPLGAQGVEELRS